MTEVTFEATIFRPNSDRNVAIDRMESHAEDPRAAMEEIQATAEAQYGKWILVGPLRRKGATGV